MMKRIKPILVSFLVLGLVGALTYPLERRVWSELEADQPALQVEDIGESMGQGILIGMFGGFRTILADLLWIQKNYYWEEFDLPATMAYINLTTAVDPRPLFFWINGARVMAFDMPVWRIRELGDFDFVPQVTIDRIQREQGELAIELLNRALHYHPDEIDFYLEKAFIYLEKVKDFDRAAEMYGIAASMEGAPAYAARLHAEMLRRAERYEEALAFLRRLHPTLTNRPQDRRETVLERIRDLEEQLSIPPAERYIPPLDRPET